MKKRFKGIDLQLFADNGDNPTPDNMDDKEAQDKPQGGEGDKEDKTFTQKELDKIIKDRLARERDKQEQEIRKIIEEEREEARRLADLTAEEREKELAKQQQKELEETKAELRRIRLEQDAIDRLNEDGLDIKFKDFLIGEDEESTNENIKTFKGVFDKAVQEAVEERLKGKTPEAGQRSIGIKNPWSSEHLNLTEQGRILREDPELAKELMKNI